MQFVIVVALASLTL